jgi:hypothetical protein
MSRLAAFCGARAVAILGRAMSRDMLAAPNLGLIALKMQSALA